MSADIARRNGSFLSNIGSEDAAKQRRSSKDKPEAPRTKDTDNPEVVLSKTLSWILRRNARVLGLDVDHDGFVMIDALLQLPNLKELDCTVEILRDHVANCPKQRFEIDGERIRASNKSKLVKSEQKPAADYKADNNYWDKPPAKGKGNGKGRDSRSFGDALEPTTRSGTAIDALFAQAAKDRSQEIWNMLKQGPSNPPPPPPRQGFPSFGGKGTDGNDAVAAMFKHANSLQNQIPPPPPAMEKKGSGNSQDLVKAMFEQAKAMQHKMPPPPEAPPALPKEKSEEKSFPVNFGVEKSTHVRNMTKTELERAVARGALFRVKTDKTQLHLLLHPKTVPDNLECMTENDPDWD